MQAFKDEEELWCLAGARGLWTLGLGHGLGQLFLAYVVWSGLIHLGCLFSATYFVSFNPSWLNLE